MSHVKLFERGKVAFNTGNYLEASKLFSRAIRLHDSSADYYYWRGLAKQAQKQYQEAIDDYDQAIKLNSLHASAFYNRGVSRYGLGHGYAAIANFNKAIELSSHPDAYYYRGKVNEDLKKNDKALEDYTAAIKANDNHIEAYEARATLHLESGHYQEAIADYDRIQKAKPKCLNCFFRRAQAKKALGQYQQAIMDYDEVTRLNSEYVDAYIQRGLCWHELEQYQKAIADYDQVIKLGIKTAVIYCKRGLAKKALRQYQLAIEDFTHSLRVNSQYASAYLYRGNVKKILEQYQEAVEDYDQANRLDPNNPDTLMNRGIVHYHLGHFEVALKDLDDAVLSKCRCLVTKYYHGRTQQALGKLPEAIADYTQVLQSNDMHVDALFQRGILWFELKEHQKAIEDYERILQIDSSHVEAKRQREIVLTAIKPKASQVLPVAGEFSVANFPKSDTQNTEVKNSEVNHSRAIFLESELKKQTLRVKELEDKQQQQAKQMEELAQKLLVLEQRSTAPSPIIYHPVSHPSMFCAKLLPHATPYRVNLPYHIFNLLITLNNSGHYAYWVGGGVRNLLLGHDIADLDIITDASGIMLSAIFPELRQNPFVPCFYKVRIDEIDIDITVCDPQTFLSIANLGHDAAKRDFTVNALYCDVYGNIYDPLRQGIIDLQWFYNIRVIGDPLQRFHNDPLLLLRAARLVSNYRFNLSDELKAMIQKIASLVTKVDKVRLQVELKRHFLRGFAVRSLATLLELNLFNAIFPKTQQFLVTEEGNAYREWLWQQLQTTDHFVLNQQSVSMNYVYALFLSGSVLFELFKKNHVPSRFEEIINKTIREIDIFDTENSYIEDIGRLILDFVTRFLPTIKQTKALENEPVSPSLLNQRQRFWSSFHSSPQPKQVNGISRVRSNSDLLTTVVQKDKAEELRINESFVPDLQSLRSATEHEATVSQPKNSM